MERTIPVYGRNLEEINNMNDLIEYAKRKLNEACAGGEDACTIRYWAGYTDGAREAQRRCNKLEEAYEAMYRDLHARTKQLERVPRS